MRKLIIAFVAFELLALTACGHAIASDRELTSAIAWTRAFKAERPEAARAIARACLARQPAALSRDGALALFTCIRRDAERQKLA